MRHLRQLTWILLALIGLPAWAAGADDTGTVSENLQQTVERVLLVLYGDNEAAPEENRTAAVREAIGDNFSFYAISRRALGRNWDRLSPEQQEEFPEAFTDLLVDTYADRYTGEKPPTVVWGETIDLSPKRKEIASNMVIDGDPVEVLYRLAPMDGKWQVYDIVAEGVSLVANYRQQFDSVIQREGPEALMRLLREKQKEALKQ